MYSSTQQVDDMWDDYFAAGDAVRERYACQIEDARREALIEQEMQEYYSKVWDAGFGTDDEAYEAYWKRTIEYGQKNGY